ncbi:MAG TPA: hypothetical protein VKD00_04060 [Methyloceanibacter sp.]|nr:hypothetical protein [Methyloceanibacter sp.]
MYRFHALLAVIALVVAAPVFAAAPQPWPWKSKAPPDPALATLSHIDDVTASAAAGTVSVAVNAMAPAPGYTELQLVSRMGDPNDRIFAFDARGRPPQEVTTQVLTPVTIEVSYADAPIAKLEVIEVYSNDNCLAYSLKDSKPVGCTSRAVPQKPGDVP